MKTKVKSSSSDKEYDVDTIELSCSCPHYLYRLQGTGQLCKHIKQVLDNPQAFKGEEIPIVTNSEELLAFIKTHNNDAVLFVEHHSEEELKRLKESGQVFESHGRLTILK